MKSILNSNSSTTDSPPTAHRQLFLLCARSPFDPRREETIEQLAALLPQIHDVSALLEAIRVERMIPLVRAWLRAVRQAYPESTASLSGSFWRQLDTLYQRAVAYNLHVINGWQQAQSALAADGITAIPIKGPALSALAYDDAALRQVEDLDAIISVEDLPKAAQILTKTGYRQVGGPRNASHHSAYAASLQDWLFEDAHNRLLDIKPVPISHRIARPQDVARVQARLAPLAMDAQGATVWQAPDCVAMTILACMHGVEEGWPILRNAADVAGLATKLSSEAWRELMSTARSWGQFRTVVFGILLCRCLGLLSEQDVGGLTSNALPTSARTQLKAVAYRLRSACPGSVSPLQAWRGVVALRDTWPLRVRCVWRQLVVPSKRDWDFVTCVCPALSARLLRPFRLLRYLLLKSL